MRKNSLFFAVLLLLFSFLISCSDEKIEEIEDRYAAMDYGTVVKLSHRYLRDEGLDPDALYYKAMSHYKMGDSASAFDSSMLYSLLYDNDDAHWYDVMRLVLHTSKSDEISIGAGQELYKKDMMSKQDYISFYTALARQKDEKLAEEVYVKVTPMMKPGEIAMMNVIAEAPSLRILSSLDRLYQTEGLSRDFIECIMISIPLFINRGDAPLLYELAKKGYANDLSYALYIGDLMYSLGKNDEAAIYWNAAREKFPEVAGKRLEELGM